MVGKVMTACVILVVLAFIGFVLKDQLKKVSMKKLDKSVKDVIPKKTTLYNGPILNVRMKKGEPWQEYTIKKEKFTVGRSKFCDLVVDLDYFSDKQFEICRYQDGNSEYFALVSYGKVNRTKFENDDTYIFLDYKDEIELEDRDIFYVGDVKFVIDTPVQTARPNTGTTQPARKGSAAPKKERFAKKEEAATQEAGYRKEARKFNI